MKIILDFDSTIVHFETLDVLADISLSGNPEKDVISKKISQLTNLGMQGEISFADSLSERIKLLALEKQYINKLNSISHKYISKSFIAHKDFIKKHKDDIYIISGGFIECILPIAGVFGINKERIFANAFIYQGNNVVGVDTSLATAKDKGKSLVAQKLDLGELSLVVGDGFTDYEIKRDGHASYFGAYIENIDRPGIRDLADVILTGVQDMQSFIQKKTSIEV